MGKPKGKAKLEPSSKAQIYQKNRPQVDSSMASSSSSGKPRSVTMDVLSDHMTDTMEQQPHRGRYRLSSTESGHSGTSLSKDIIDAYLEDNLPFLLERSGADALNFVNLDKDSNPELKTKVDTMAARVAGYRHQLDRQRDMSIDQPTVNEPSAPMIAEGMNDFLSTRQLKGRSSKYIRQMIGKDASFLLGSGLLSTKSGAGNMWHQLANTRRIVPENGSQSKTIYG